MFFEQFVTYVKEHLLEGWREDEELTIQDVKKNNDVNLRGFTISKRDSEEGQIVPTLYLEVYYQLYRKGMSADQVLAKIREDYDQACHNVPDSIPDVKDFHQMRYRIFFRLINYEKNQELLMNSPFLKLYDLAISFRWVSSVDEDGISSAMVTKEDLSEWGISIKDLYAAARRNTEFMFSAKILPLQNMLPEELRTEEDDVPMFVLTNEVSLNGATVILYEGLLEKLGEKLQEGFYILPSSLHEMIMIPEHAVEDPQFLARLVHDANRTVVDPKDILSDCVYYYQPSQNRLLLADLDYEL
ncbi:MAG: DUF5688 family protein [Lachnospiraceae bacterium]|nr:DUF5688 family protein [Lachnospiraceae bacterium]